MGRDPRCAVDEIEEVIRPAGIPRSKARQIKSILRAITDTAPGGELSLDARRTNIPGRP